MDPLAQLNDISLGAPVGLWPLAWGWWALLALIVICLTTLLTLWRKRSRYHLVRRLAIVEINKIAASDLAVQAKLSEMNKVLKQCAKHYHTASNVNRLYGESWGAWLSSQIPAKFQPRFQQGFAPVALSLYGSQVDLGVNNNDLQQLENNFTDAALLWLSKVRFSKVAIDSPSPNLRGEHV